MRNELVITGTDTQLLLSQTDDGTNTLFINGVEVPQSEWVGEGAPAKWTTAEGQFVVIGKVKSADGNLMLQRSNNDELFVYDFVQYVPPSKALIRTYERGVEAESGACGTGAVATAVAGVEAHGMSLPMHVRSSQGYDLVVDGDYRQSHGTGFTLTGPVRVVFEGELDLDLLAVEPMN
jgi:hypothetical protein